MTLQELSKAYRELPFRVREYFTFEEYVKTYGTLSEFKELLQLENAMQSHAEQNAEVI